jgi:Ca-activated chloride channel family protein
MVSDEVGMDDDTPGFRIQVSQNRYLSVEDRRMDLVVNVWSGATGSGAPPQAAQVLLVDSSGSMGDPPAKMAAARRAAMAAVDTLRDGSLFAVVAGTHQTEPVYPDSGGLARADPATRAAAHRAIRTRLVAHGGTAIGAWLAAADALLGDHPDAIRHALLLTDGRNEHETDEQLDAVLRRCAGRFTCDARGVGEGWRVDELRRVVTALRGRAEALAVHEVEEDFRALTEALMGKQVADVRLRLALRPGTGLRTLKQVFPTDHELSPDADAGVGAGERGPMDVALGSWGAGERRDYLVSLDVDPAGQPPGEDLLVADVRLVAGPGRDEVSRRTAVVVHWTDDDALSVPLDDQVSHYTAQEELGAEVVAGCEAYDAGRPDEALAHWSAARAMAEASGNAELLRRLSRLIEVGEDGRPRLRPDLTRSDFLSAEVGSNLSVQSRPADPGDDPAAGGDDLTCPDCGRISPPGTTRCEQCGRPLAAGGGGP